MSLSPRDLLKQMAIQAKNRLKCHSENKAYDTKRNNIRVLYSSNLPVIKILQEDVEAENRLYASVVDILKNGECSNPLSKLCDEKVFTKLSSIDKERYILTLSKKYQQLKERYHQELMAK